MEAPVLGCVSHLVLLQWRNPAIWLFEAALLVREGLTDLGPLQKRVGDHNTCFGNPPKADYDELKSVITLKECC
jgi:hypothetical protein